MASHGIVIEIIGDEKSYLRSAQTVISTNTKMDASFKQVGVNANLSADAQIKAALKAQDALKVNAAALASRAASLPGGSREQAAATLLAAEAQTKYARAIGVRSANTERLSGSMSRLKSVAVGGAGFLGFVFGAQAVEQSIRGAEDLEAAQRSLEVAIQHTGGNVETLGARYLATAKAAAQFGVTQVDATRGLARATVLTGDAESAQRAYEEALVISKATGKEFNTVLIAASKGQAGVTTALRRYGILVDSSSSGQDQLNFVMKRFGGQAEANTTATERFSAVLHNFSTSVGTSVLPAVNDLLSGLTKVLNKLQEISDFRGRTADKAGHFGFLFQSLPKLIDDANSRLEKMFANLNQFNDRLLGNVPGNHSGVPISPTFGQLPPVLGGPTTGSSGFGAGATRIRQIATFSLNHSEQLAQAQAGLTRGSADDVKAARDVVARVKRLIDHGKLHGPALIQALQAEASAMTTIWSAEDAAAQKRAEAAQAAADRIAARIQDSIDPLRLEVALSRAQALGKPLISILRKLRSAAQKALASGKLSLEQQKEAWDQIASINDQLASQSAAQTHQFHLASTKALTAGLHLTDEQRRALRARLSQLGPGGHVPDRGTGAYGYEIGSHGRPIHVHTTVRLDGKKVATNTTKHQQRARRRSSSQRRGPNAGD